MLRGSGAAGGWECGGDGDGEGCRSGGDAVWPLAGPPRRRRCDPSRAEFVVEQVGLQVGFGLMLKNVGSTFGN